MARRYKVEGTNDFLVAAIALAALGLWCVKDGWFPSATVLERHPHEVPVTAGKAAIVMEVVVAPGQEIGTNTVVARVRSIGAAGTGEGTAAPEDVRELRCGYPGMVKDVPGKRMDAVTATQPIVVVLPEGSFYSFNKSLAFITLIGAIACAVIHLAVR